MYLPNRWLYKETNDDDGIYDIYVLDLSTNLWGQTQYESGGSTFIKIRNSYQVCPIFVKIQINCYG